MRKKMCPTTQPCDLLRTLALLITVLLISYPAQGQVGSISAQAFLCGSNPNGSDLTVNTSNNTVWTIDSTSGSVCVFNSTQSPAALTLASTIDHLVGPAVAPLGLWVGWEPGSAASQGARVTEVSRRSAAHAGCAISSRATNSSENRLLSMGPRQDGRTLSGLDQSREQ